MASLEVFLCDRLQQVILPTVMLVYINDIVDLFHNSGVYTKLYADDVKIYLEITDDSDYVTLQDGINKIYAWSGEWQLRLANDKCQHNHITLSTAHVLWIILCQVWNCQP